MWAAADPGLAALALGYFLPPAGLRISLFIHPVIALQAPEWDSLGLLLIDFRILEGNGLLRLVADSPIHPFTDSPLGRADGTSALQRIGDIVRTGRPRSSDIVRTGRPRAPMVCYNSPLDWIGMVHGPSSMIVSAAVIGHRSPVIRRLR